MKVALICLALVVLAGALFWRFGPVEDAALDGPADLAGLEGGVDAWFAAQEGRFDDITAGAEKRVIWAGAPGAQTEWAVLYVHGFSATSEEIRPVPDDVAAALGANLVYTRLTGHGRGAAPMGTARVADWMQDTRQALAAARAVGRRVLVLSVSTGGTLVTAALAQGEAVDGAVFLSPNFGINNPAAPLLTWPGVRHWLPPILGRTYAFEPRNDAQARFWTTSYPSVALLPVAALVKAVRALDLSGITAPALFIYAAADQVVVAAQTDAIVARWPARAEVEQPVMGPGDDASAHVIAGDILSPGRNAATVERILAFARSL
ncbi:MAG: alpha/beta fold hydrolase [Pseudomonadota bacterium]